MVTATALAAGRLPCRGGSPPRHRRGAGCMADQLGSDMVAGQSAEGAQRTPLAGGGPATVSHHGRPVSWVAVSTIMAAFLVGGFGLVLGPIWWLVWVGVGMGAVGGPVALATNIFNDWY